MCFTYSEIHYRDFIPRILHYYWNIFDFNLSWLFTVSHAPPVGSYNVTSDSDKSTGPVTFDHGNRFEEKKGMNLILLKTALKLTSKNDYNR